MSKILVTGGAGYIGSHACKMLSAAGHDVVVVDNLSRGHESAVRWGLLEQVDLLDYDKVLAVFKTHAPDAVMHFAAFGYVGESVQKPGMYWRNNVAGSLNLLRAMTARGVKRLIFSSSCAVYGESTASLIDEQHPLQPVNPYGRSKLVVEGMISDLAASGGMNAVSLRYFNAAGADPDGELGESHDPETHLIPLGIEAAMDGGRALTVFGTDYSTEDGTCVRDYIHVQDIADAHVRALNLLDDATGSYAFNLGNSGGFSVKEVIAAVARVTGCEPVVELGSPRPGDPARLVADPELARTTLGWKPDYPALDDMVATAWRWRISQAQ